MAQESDAIVDDFIRFGPKALLAAIVSVTTKLVVGVICLYQLYSGLTFFAELPEIAITTWLVGAAALFGWFWSLAVIGHFLRSYKLDGEALHARYGVLRRRHSVVPLNRIQHADITRNIFERILGMASLVVYTAGVRHYLVAINYLDHQIAIELLKKVLPTDDE